MAWTKKSRAANSKRTTAQNLRQWADKTFHKKMCKVRRAQCNRPEELKKNSERLKLLWEDPIYRAMQSAARKGRKPSPSCFKKGVPSWNAGHTKETHPGLAKISATNMGRIPDYKKYGLYYEGPKGKIWMRSSWEVAFAVWCDTKGFAWEYEPCYFRIGKGSWVGETYTPDFYLTEQDMWVEIKGHLSEPNFCKLRSFLQQHPNQSWIMLRRGELEVLGALRKAA